MKTKIKILITLLIMASISVGAFFLLKSLGVTSVDKLRKIISSCGAWSWVVFIILFILCANLLCFIPGLSATFIAVSILLFGAWQGFIISTISVFLSSSLMFWLGDTLGERAAIKIVGKESLEKAQKLLDVKSKILLPLMFLFPVFPDDAICLVAGMTKMKYWYFAIVALIFRTIGIATICFLGGGIIDWSTLTWVDWFCLINICIYDICLIFYLSNKLEKKILKRGENKMELKKKTIKLSTIAKIQRLTVKLFEAQDDDYVDGRAISIYNRNIDRYLSTITDDVGEQLYILKAIERGNWNSEDLSYKPICDNLRALGYEIIEENKNEKK